ncbi:hypothetical protein HK101_011779 [Irineochytrium annulatum]|nr:hypothetical protein HK101_011779 [Irineochytrium annulatum]
MEIIRDLGVMLREKGGEEEEWGPDFGETCKVAVEALVPAVINAFENHVYGSVVGISEGGPLADSKWIKEPILEFIPKVIAPPPVIDPVPAGRSALAEQVNGVKDRREADTSGDAVEAVPGGVAEADGAVAVAEVTEVVANNNE